jgi:2-dehydro-3-deoxygalactonokinase
MITSNVGLTEIPHIIAPAGIDDLSSALVKASIPQVSEKNFIPGI